MFLYGMVPLMFRPLAANLVSAVWGIIFSFVVHNY